MSMGAGVHLSLGAGGWLSLVLLVAGWLFLVAAGCWQLVSGCWLLVDADYCCWLLRAAC